MSLSFTLAELAKLLGAELHGDPAVIITGVAGIEEAEAGRLTFVANRKYAAAARTTRAGAILVEPRFPAVETPTLRLENPYLAFARAIELFHQPPVYAPGIHPTAVIAPTARIGKDAHIGAYATVGEEVTIGDHATLLPHVVIYPKVSIGEHFFAHAHAVVRENCRIGDHVLLQNGVVIGGDGFGFAKQADGSWYKIPQSGPTILEDRVEVQANSCIDRASIGETRIGAGSKIDNLVQVGHSSSVGRDTLLCAQVGLAGTTTVGNSVILAGQVGVAGHCTIGDNVVVTAQSGTHGYIAPGRMVSGSPAFDHRQWMRSTAIFSRLPELMRNREKTTNETDE